MVNDKETKATDPRKKLELAKSLALVDQTVDKKYVSNLERMRIFEPKFAVEGISGSQDRKPIRQIGSNANLIELTRFVYDEDESIQDKLISVYQSVASYENAKVFMLIRSTEAEQKIYFGICSDYTETEGTLLENQLTALESNFKGNFPGSSFRKFKNIPGRDGKNGISVKKQKETLLKGVFRRGRNVAAISGIPSLKSERREENKQFVQGIEKVLDSILGQNVDVLILAEPVSTNEFINMRNGYQEIYSNISPFAKSVINVTATNGDSVTETITKGVTETTNESVAKTHTHTLTQGTNSSHSVGGHVGGNVKGLVDIGVDYHYTHGKHRDTSESDGETITEGVSNSLSDQNSVANGLSSSHSDGLQIEYENKSIKEILEKIDKQLDRMKECEDYGMYDCGVYILSDDYASVISASASFKSIMRGKESSAQAAYINSWKKEDTEVVTNMMEYLATFNHPVFSLHKRSEESEMILPVTPATIISGRELAIQMGLPRKSVSGIPVIKTARFGRKVLYIDESVKAEKEINLGKIYHMNQCEAGCVSLNADTLPSHVFITGATGSGKSTTVYKLLSETIDSVENCHFMIIEPAKGEYKYVFGGRNDVTVYGSNLYEIENLLKINPFSFPENKIHVLEHIDRLIGIFNACWPMYAAMPAILKDSIERAYLDAGWDLTKSKCEYKTELGQSIYPGFADVLRQVNYVLKESQYSEDSKGDYTGALVTRLKSLTNGINGLIFSSNEIKDSDLFDKNVILDLSRISGDETKSLIMGMLLIKLQEYRIANRKGTDEAFQHITILEEAHNILKRTSTEQASEGANLVGKSVEMIANAIAEMRTYGEAFVIVDQSPSAVDMSAIRNTNTKIIMRLPDITDREQVGKAAGLNDEQIAELTKLKTGVAAIYQNNWVEPVLCQIDGKSIRKAKYLLPKGYEADWSDDEVIVKELVDVLLSPFDETNYITTTKAFLKQVFATGVSTDVKVKLFEFHNSKSVETKKRLAEDMIFNLLFDDIIWKKSMAYKENIKEWYALMEKSIRPDISDMDRQAIDMILQILAYKQGQYCREKNFQNGFDDAGQILQELQHFVGRRMNNV